VNGVPSDVFKSTSPLEKSHSHAEWKEFSNLTDPSCFSIMFQPYFLHLSFCSQQNEQVSVIFFPVFTAYCQAGLKSKKGSVQ
jgi:hypothetical protein